MVFYVERKKLQCPYSAFTKSLGNYRRETTNMREFLPVWLPRRRKAASNTVKAYRTILNQLQNIVSLCGKDPAELTQIQTNLPNAPLKRRLFCGIMSARHYTSAGSPSDRREDIFPGEPCASAGGTMSERHGIISTDMMPAPVRCPTGGRTIFL